MPEGVAKLSLRSGCFARALDQTVSFQRAAPRVGSEDGGDSPGVPSARVVMRAAILGVRARDPCHRRARHRYLVRPMSTQPTPKSLLRRSIPLFLVGSIAIAVAAAFPRTVVSARADEGPLEESMERMNVSMKALLKGVTAEN